MKLNPDNPSTTFFCNDWDNEPGMKFCCLAAQGLWVKMLSLAARSRDYGVVLIGEHPSARQDLPALLAPSCGESVEMIGALVDQLVTFKVAAIDDAGRVFNRRMVAEGKISAERAAAGKRGGAAPRRKQKSSKRGSKTPSKTPSKMRGSVTSNNASPLAIDTRQPSETTKQNGSNLGSKSEASSFFTLSSVSKDTGAGAPIDKAKVTFGTCLAYLIERSQ